MAEKHWQEWGDECSVCGSIGEVFTSSPDPHTGYDQDKCRCMDCGCPGMLVVGDCDSAYISWEIDNHPFRCSCEWCEKAEIGEEPKKM